MLGWKMVKMNHCKIGHNRDNTKKGTNKFVNLISN